MKRSIINHKKFLIKIVVIALWLLLWQGVYFTVGEDLLLVSPIAAGIRMAQLALTSYFWIILLHSVSRIFSGYLLGILLGILIASLTARFPLCYEFFSLPMTLIRTTPVSSFIILALVWISGTNLSVFISFLMVLPLIWSNVHSGLLSVDPKLLEMAQVYQLSRLDILRHIKLPAVLPFFLSAVKVSLGFAWKAGIAGEVLSIPKNAIGTQLYHAKIYLDTIDLFAWTGVVILMSVLIEKLLICGMNSLFPPNKEEKG